jgi:hypothetical protein
MAIAALAAVLGLAALIMPTPASAEGGSLWDNVDETKTAPRSCPVPGAKPRSGTTQPVRGSFRNPQNGTPGPSGN